MEKPFYLLVMFPYPSGTGLHVGHVYNYALADSYGRWLRSKGKTVFQPFGYDAFGLPAENYAKSINGNPKTVTNQNISNIRLEMDKMNTLFREQLSTHESTYYMWSQWLFNLLKAKGLAYKANRTEPYCPKCETGLAHAEIIECDIHERCGTRVIQKEMNQWFFKITAYKQRLLNNLDKLDYPKSTISQQRHWLNNLQDWCISRQRKWGTPIPLQGEEDTMDTFVDSSFYYLRYICPDSFDFIDTEKVKSVMPVDLYIGGAEHACMHLIYARFINMVLFDEGYSPVEEPFKRVFHQGMITKSGMKMSKSKGNTVDISQYNPDELRMYLMFIGPYAEGGDWQEANLKGITRFLTKVKSWLDTYGQDEIDVDAFEKQMDSDFENLRFNKVISNWMILIKSNKTKVLTRQQCLRLRKLFLLIAPSTSWYEPAKHLQNVEDVLQEEKRIDNIFLKNRV
jgi:leucyl-tRNA synthetase